MKGNNSKIWLPQKLWGVEKRVRETSLKREKDHLNKPGDLGSRREKDHLKFGVRVLRRRWGRGAEIDARVSLWRKMQTNTAQVCVRERKERRGEGRESGRASSEVRTESRGKVVGWPVQSDEHYAENNKANLWLHPLESWLHQIPASPT